MWQIYITGNRLLSDNVTDIGEELAMKQISLYSSACNNTTDRGWTIGDEAIGDEEDKLVLFSF